MTFNTLSIPDSVPLGNYLVAFLDILGHSSEIASSPEVYSPGMEDDGSFDRTFIRPARGLARLAESLDETYDTFLSPATLPRLRKLQEENPGLTAPSVHAIPFSDGIVLYVPLREEESLLPVLGATNLLVAIGHVFPFSIADEFPFRCGIELGWGTELFPNHIVGRAVLGAVELEKAAGFPRIAVGGVLTEFLRSYQLFGEAYRKANQVGQFNSHLAEYSLNLISTGDDGIRFVDYLSDRFLGSISRDEFTPIVNKAKYFAESKEKHFQDKEDAHIAKKYTRLLHYLSTYNPVKG